MASWASIGEFCEEREEFRDYICRFESLMIASDIDDAAKKASIFRAVIGCKLFKLLRNKLTPVDPMTATFDRMVTVLRNHYEPKKNLLTLRHIFYKTTQKPNESISDFSTRLREKAVQCEFGNNLDMMCQDFFILGLSDESTVQTLLTTSDLTFNKAVDIAVTRQMAHADARTFHKADHDVYTVSSNSRKDDSKNYSSNSKHSNATDNKSKPSSSCSGCGSFHWKKDCPFKDAECFSCGRKGHLKKYCRNKPKGKSTSKNNTKGVHKVSSVSKASKSYSSYVESSNLNCDNEYEGEIFNLSSNNFSTRPYIVEVKINGSSLNMELDTGASKSVISKHKYDQLWRKDKPTISRSNVNLHTYGGEPLPVEGEIEVNISTMKCPNPIKANIMIVSGNGPCLLGRDLISILNITSLATNVVSDSQEKFKLKFPELFAPGLGTLKNQTFSLTVDPNIPPKFCKFRTVPYALRAKVEDELDRLVAEGIISPVPFSRWAAAIVNVIKSDGSIRICGDYKLTVNKAAKVDSYPIPRLEDLFSCLSGNKLFTKLDMTQAYAQLKLSEESKPYTVINTHKGLFQYNRLCFGVSAAPAIFQRAMEQLLCGLPGVVCYLDDILIAGSSVKQHEERVCAVLTRLQDNGLKCKISKCSFGMSEVSYLGYRIGERGILPESGKVTAIAKAPIPTNVKSLQSFLGTMNFYRRFLKNISSVTEPLNKLLRKGEPWKWSKEQQVAFDRAKELLVQSDALVLYDPSKPLTIISDSSSYGIGAVLCHLIDGDERPICFASRTLNDAERNYSQLEKEALAIIFAIKRFHNFVYGRQFKIITDHKPLLGLFSCNKSIPVMASGRIQRWALILQAYTFDLQHRSGLLLGTADCLSRLPLAQTCDNIPVLGEWKELVNFLDSSPVTASCVASHTRTDKLLSKVYRSCEVGWTTTPPEADLKPYYIRKDELSIEAGCLLWGYRIIIPSNLRGSILNELHSGHIGASRMKGLARNYFWWPGLDGEIERLVRECTTCLEQRSLPPKAALHPWDWPSQPWHRIHIDYAGPVNNKYFLIVVDAFSKWTNIYVTPSPTSAETVKFLRSAFATFGIPVSVVSDNGTCFTSEEFKTFMHMNGIRHTTSAVNKPSTNGLAERMVQTFKHALKKSNDKLDVFIDRFLFKYRLAPHATTGVSPAELMFKRRPRCRFDLLQPREAITERVSKKQDIQRASRMSSRHINVDVGDPVIIRNYAKGPKWLPAEVARQTGPVSYECALDSGNIVRRHQDQIHLREGTTTTQVEDHSHEQPGNGDYSISDEITETPTAELTDTLGDVEVPAPNTSPVEPPVLRRSTRVRRQVVKLDL